MSKPYEREIYVDSFRGMQLFRVTERPMLDPLFDVDMPELAIVKYEMLDNEQGWVDVTGRLTPKQEAAVLDSWQRAYDKDFCDKEVTQPMFVPRDPPVV